MTQTVNDMMKSLHAEPRQWSIWVVPDNDPNADSREIDCGYHTFPQAISFGRTTEALDAFRPEGHHIVSVRSTK